MIGILADEAERSAICEFFELFKTPWELYRRNSQHDVLICSNRPIPETSAKLVLVYGTDERTFDENNGVEIHSRYSNTVVSYRQDRIPIYGDCLTFKRTGSHPLIHEQTGEPVLAEIGSLGQTFVRIGFNLFEEIHFLLTSGQPLTYARIPTLELHITVLRDLIVSHSHCIVEIPPVPAGYNFVVCLTHDVDHAGIRNHKCDHTMFGFLYRATVGSLINVCRGRRSVGYLAGNWIAVLSLPLVYLGLIKDFWNQFDRYLGIEDGLNSTFFVIPKKGDPGQTTDRAASVRRAARYDVAQIADEIRKLIVANREIGVHGVDAWRDVNEGRTELAAIQRLTGKSEVGVRMHWLFFDQDSPARLERAGFSYDSSIGYNETVGYRSGTTQAFKPLGLARMLELPMHIMDTALFYSRHMNLSPKQAHAVIDEVVDNARRFGGVITINWHDRSIAPERLWGDVYIRLVDQLQKMGAWFPTAAQAVSWFRKRRSAVVENVVHDGDRVRVKVSLDDRMDDLPGLKIRAYRPVMAGKTESANGFTEATISQSGEFELAI
jgi:hypothetical protein